MKKRKWHIEKLGNPFVKQFTVSADDFIKMLEVEPIEIRKGFQSKREPFENIKDKVIEILRKNKLKKGLK